MTTPQTYSVNAFGDLIIKATRFADGRIHYQFTTAHEKPAMVHAFDSQTELTTQEAFKRVYHELAHWVNVTTDMDHLSRNDAVRLVLSTARDLFDESISKDMKDAKGNFLSHDTTVHWQRTAGRLLTTHFEVVVRDQVDQNSQLGVVVSSKITITTDGNADNLSPQAQYDDYMKAFGYGPAHEL